MKRFFTGKPCKRGSVDERMSADGRCLCCARENTKSKPSLYKTSSVYRQKQSERQKQEKHVKKKRESQKKRRSKPDYKEVRKRHYQNTKKEPAQIARRFLRYDLRRVIEGNPGHFRAESAVGYTRDDLIKTIEMQFTKGMSWDNYGEWHIDHIVSVKWFLDQCIEDPSIINSLSNLRPIWALDNLSKGSASVFLI